jgi:hypothetical protein
MRSRERDEAKMSAGAIIPSSFLPAIAAAALATAGSKDYRKEGK